MPTGCNKICYNLLFYNFSFLNSGNILLFEMLLLKNIINIVYLHDFESTTKFLKATYKSQTGINSIIIKLLMPQKN